MPIILSFFIGHWFLSTFLQSFFQHRYSAHQMFVLSPFWQKFFYVLTFLVQGSSFLNPRTYAILHRKHHAFSDTLKDPHSPVTSKSFIDMLLKTANGYDDIRNYKTDVEKEFKGHYPEMPTLDKYAESIWVRLIFVSFYSAFYIYFVPKDAPWLYALLPIHFFMAKIQGSIVNWCGHLYGYRNHSKNPDNSRNTLSIDFIILGELYQNNHHAHPNSPNFAFKWFEIDFTFQILKVLHFLKIVRIQRAVWSERGRTVLPGSIV
ncbi:stearoyl-CoA 9-desaturase [Leptospira broomii serovar Hurstbridge str. 5399]|uniref:Stearoyl-CoA 9-desaturase n=1 Tax=Leptospira broomii serovar Hurstbridge str. 5399 TaxID=1049789 RepID=T0F777_9LEPT|nr:acyl-CoA desaturase [Leptospira broomii]EQA43766.1 stearoyl-CoA 9-desaturase [Leptospira broomii serovar Hurstbridge str. 5399]